MYAVYSIAPFPCPLPPHDPRVSSTMSERLSPPSPQPVQPAHGGPSLGNPSSPPPEPGSLDWLLARQCRLGPADAGAILRWPANAPAAEAMAIFPRLPENAAAPKWMEVALRAVERLRTSDAQPTQNNPLAPASWFVLPFDDRAGPHSSPAFVVVQPLPTARAEQALVSFGAFLVRAQRPDVAVITERLTAGWAQAESRELRTLLARESARVRQSALVIELSGVLAEHTRFKALATALCDQLSARLGCERVSLGLGTGPRNDARTIRVRAMSHAEKIVPGAQSVQEIEMAMEECADQDTEIAIPPPPGAPPTTWIDRATRELTAHADSRAALSLPIRTRAVPDDAPVAHIPGISESADAAGAWRTRGVLTLERSGNRPFTAEEIDALRVLVDVTAPRLVQLAADDLWPAARLLGSLRRALATLLGPRHTWLKLAALALIGCIVFLAIAKGTYRVECSFHLDSVRRQIVPAPFDGFLREVPLHIGDQVIAGQTILAKLDDTQLRLQAAESRAEIATFLKEFAVAQQEGKVAEAQIARANAEKVQARIELLQHQIAQATLIAPISGTIVEGDLERMRGAPVQTGQTLFEIAPIDALRAELLVPEDQIGDITLDKSGHLAAAALPEEHVPFTIERIDPIAQVVDQANVFRVRARLTETRPWMRPGMEGIAKVDIDRRLYASIWSRRLINWVRMKLWF